jgi:prepilin-type N-terminal cleavage/methylation domain-containing protein
MKNLRKMRGFSLIELLVVMVIFMILTAMVAQILVRTSRDYLSRRATMEAQNNGRIALDAIVRLVRMAGNDPNRTNFADPIHPDPDNNGVMDSIRLRGDWNPPDGDITDARENMTFTVLNNVLRIQEPGMPQPVDFVDRVQGLTFTYFDRDNVAIADPVVNRAQIASVDIQLRIVVPDGQPMTFRAGSTIRRRERQ